MSAFVGLFSVATTAWARPATVGVDPSKSGTDDGDRPSPSTAPAAAAMVVAVAIGAMTGMVAGRLEDGGGGSQRGDNPAADGIADDDRNESALPEAAATESSARGSETVDYDIFGSSTGEPVEPLPGEDWNTAARTRFIEGCPATPSGRFVEVGLGPAAARDYCACAYDAIAASGLTFAELNEARSGGRSAAVWEVVWPVYQDAVLACAPPQPG